MHCLVGLPIRRYGIALAAALPLFAGIASAQELEPRAYSNVPVGLNFLVVAYAYSDGDVATEATAPLRDGNVELHGPLLAYARSIDLGGRSGKIDVILPYGWTSGSATVLGERRHRDVSGLGDPRLRLSMNLYGAPSLSLSEFADYEPDVVVGASVQVRAPLGQYDSDKLLNIGSNRWTIKPEIGMAKTWERITLELSAGLAIYSDNDDYLSGKELAQEPVHSLQAHVTYNFPWHIWAAFDFTYYGGGKTRVDNIAATENIESTRAGGTLALPLSRYQSLKLFGSTGTTTRIGSDFDLVGLAWQYRWGAGL